MAVDAQPLVTVTSALAPAAPSPSAAEPQNALKEEVEQGGVAEPKEEPEKTKRKKAAPDSRAYQLWFLAWACLMHQNHGWSWRSSWVKPRNSAEPAAPYPATVAPPTRVGQMSRFLAMRFACGTASNKDLGDALSPAKK